MNIPYEDEITPPFLQAHIRAFLESISIALKVAKNEKGYPLQFRWNVFAEIRPFLPKNWVYMDFQTLEDIREVSWYDDFNLDREAVMDLDEDFVKRATGQFQLTPQQVDSLREEIIQSGYGSFENDW